MFSHHNGITSESITERKKYQTTRKTSSHTKMKKHISEQSIGLRESQAKCKKRSELNENATKLLDAATVAPTGKLTALK